jgi:hypothetical protein
LMTAKNLTDLSPVRFFFDLQKRRECTGPQGPETGNI